LVEEAYAKALNIVSERRVALAAIAEHLCEVETMDGDELDRWLEKHPSSHGKESELDCWLEIRPSARGDENGRS
jgi:hypothetical protein